jgi:hypothetical protein
MVGMKPPAWLFDIVFVALVWPAPGGPVHLTIVGA